MLSEAVVGVDDGVAEQFVVPEFGGVSVDPGRSGPIARVLFPGAALPNRTCDFHRIRLSVGHVGTGVSVQGVGILLPRYRYRWMRIETGLKSRTPP